MRSKLTIALAVLLLAILAMPHTAEADGFKVTKTTGLDNVVESGNNQLVAKVHFILGTGDDQPIDREANEDLTIMVKFGDLPIIQATAWADTDVTDTTPGAALPAAIKAFDTTTTDVQWKYSSGAKSIEIFIDSAAAAVTGSYGITLADLRLDVSSLGDGDKVPIMVTSSTGAGTVGLGGGSGSGSVSDSIATAKDGLTVEATKAQDLSCGTPVAEGLSVTVAEGFGMAWSMGSAHLMAGQSGMFDETTPANSNLGAEDDVAGAVAIRLEVSGLPDGAMIEWPDDAKDTRKDEDAATNLPATDTTIATLTRDKENSSANGMVAIYMYSQADAAMDDTDTAGTTENQGLQPYIPAAARKFKIEGIKIKNFGEAANIDVKAQLWPMVKRNSDGKKNAADLASTLSFEHELEAPKFADDAREGSWLVVSECVTYLLYPFVTCGGTGGWSTAMSVSNTSKDAGVFGAFDTTTDQSGSVTLYGFPMGAASDDDALTTMVHSDLAAGDTHTFDCGDTAMSGMDGYAIIKANFQHARGTAFLMANFKDGAGIDVAHGYVAEVIDNPAERTDTLSE